VVRDRYGVIVTKEVLLQAAYDRAVKNLEADFLFEGRGNEYSILKSLPYGLNFDRYADEIILQMEDEEQELLRSIQSVKLMVIENEEINQQINLAKVMARVKPDRGVVPLLRVNDGKDDVLILAKQEEHRISELYVVVGGDENVMIRIKGQMDKDLMKRLYDVTGIEQTKYARKI
jgi:hypothetical protein